MKFNHVGKDLVALKMGKEYMVLDIKHGTYKIITELEKTYFIPKDSFQNEEEYDFPCPKMRWFTRGK